MDELLTINEAAESLGLAASTLRHQVKRGRLQAHQMGTMWLVTRAEVERYRDENLGRPGRPKLYQGERCPKCGGDHQHRGEVES